MHWHVWRIELLGVASCKYLEWSDHSLEKLAYGVIDCCTIGCRWTCAKYRIWNIDQPCFFFTSWSDQPAPLLTHAASAQSYVECWTLISRLFGDVLQVPVSGPYLNTIPSFTGLSVLCFDVPRCPETVQASRARCRVVGGYFLDTG